MRFYFYIIGILSLSFELTCRAAQRSSMSKSEQLGVSEGDEPFQQSEDPNDANHDDAPMIHTYPVDYRANALRNRVLLEAEGKEVFLQSELPSHIPRQPNESDVDYTKRFSDTMNSMIQRGVYILSDEITHDIAPSIFDIYGREFDVGPESGITKGEYRDFSQWMGSKQAEEEGYEGMPERFRKFEVAKETS